MKPITQLRSLVAVPVALVALTACGTTVPLTQQQGAAQGGLSGGGTGLGTDGGGAAAGSPSSLGLGGPASGRSGPRSVGSVSGAVGTGRVPAGGGTSSSVPTAVVGPGGKAAPGVTATTMTVGYFRYEGTDEGLASVGIKAASYGDPFANTKAAVAEVNRQGGVLGRKLVVSYYAYPPTTTKSFPQQSQEICEHFTTDVKVFAVAPVGDKTMRECLAGRGVLPLASSVGLTPISEYRRRPTFVDTAGYEPVAAMRALVAALSRTDYLQTKWDTSAGKPGGVQPVRVGVLSSDEDNWKEAVRDGLLPALKAVGVQVSSADVIEYHKNNSAGEASDTISSIQSAVLKFASQGVTHVIAPDATGLGFFTQAAYRQNYRPRYAVSSYSAPQGQVNSGLTPASQLHGAVGLGWLPTVDLTDASRYAGSGQAACLQVMRRGGVTPKSSTELAGSDAACDLWNVFQRMVDLGKAASAESAAAGLAALGSSLSLAALPHGSFTADKHYAVDSGYLLAWDSGCECATYDSGLFRL